MLGKVVLFNVECRYIWRLTWLAKLSIHVVFGWTYHEGTSLYVMAHTWTVSNRPYSLGLNIKNPLTWQRTYSNKFIGLLYCVSSWNGLILLAQKALKVRKLCLWQCRLVVFIQNSSTLLPQCSPKASNAILVLPLVSIQDLYYNSSTFICMIEIPMIKHIS